MPAPLNDAQLEAVNHNAGPLMVLAGPGTGKTRVIVHRIQRLIDSGAEPAHILAVTFTVKAAAELRRRLADLVGPAKADRVHARTFHGFGQHLLKRFGDLMDLPPRHLIIDSAQRVRLAREVARRDGLLSAYAGESLDALLVSSLECATALEHAGLFPDRVEEFCADWLARIDAHAGGLFSDSARAERARYDRFLAMARLHASCSVERRRRGQLTYEDLVLLSVGLLRASELARTLCRDEFRHVVVDEFQDVNAGQIELLRALCPAGADLCVVGDDDQSIYLFRGADDRAFSKFAASWPGAPTIPLTENYRSEPCILAAAAATISRAAERFAPDKVVAQAEILVEQPPAPGSAVECVECDDDSRQFGEAIAALVKTDRARNPARPWSSYAAIATSHLDLSRIAAVLEAEGIPYIPSQPPSAIDDAGVRDVLAWVGLLSDPANTAHAHRLLVRPPIGAAPALVNGWLLAFGAQRSRHRLGDDTTRDPGDFTAWLTLHHGADPAAARFLRVLDAMRSAALQHPADRALLEVIRLCDAAHADLCPPRDRARRIAAFADLLRLARDRAPLLDPPGDLRAFHAYFADLSESDQRAFQRDEEDRLEGSPDDADQPDAITLITAYKAKGLEFDTVFVVRVGPQHGFGKVGSDDFELPEGLEDRAGDTRDHKQRRRAEARRLFYVACTRAKRRLILLAKRKASRTEGDYFQELTAEPGLVTRLAAERVFVEAAAAGVTLASRAAVFADIAADLRAGWEQELAAQRSAARADAATALDSLDRAGTDEADLDAAAEILGNAAARLAVIAAMEHSGAAPAWAGAVPAAAALGDSLSRRLAGENAPMPSTRPMTPPLQLSYSAVNNYLECPRCFYLKQVAGFPEPATSALLIGDLAHRALESHFTALRRHESGEGPPPADISRAARALYFASLPPGVPADESTLARLGAMIAAGARTLHQDTDEVSEIEFKLNFPYTHNAIEHKFITKMDRLDLWPAGGHRIIDYKTGRLTDALASPEPDDLQLGVYALALRHHQGIPLSDRDTPARGVAEYWHLPTASRGRIDLAKIDYASIRGKIDVAISGMLAGRFEPKKGCKGLCTYLTL